MWREADHAELVVTGVEFSLVVEELNEMDLERSKKICERRK